jgi:hypothetical protein
MVFPLQQWLRERALMLRYTYVTSSVYFLASNDGIVLTSISNIYGSHAVVFLNK